MLTTLLLQKMFGTSSRRSHNEVTALIQSVCFCFLYKLILSSGSCFEILFWADCFWGRVYFQLGRIESCKFVKVSYFSDICGRSVIF